MAVLRDNRFSKIICVEAVPGFYATFFDTLQALQGLPKAVVYMRHKDLAQFLATPKIIAKL